MGQDLMAELAEKMDLMNRAIGKLCENGRIKADTERAYRVALAKKIAELRADGTQITIIGDMARGDAQVAELKFSRDMADSNYEATQEGINVYKLSVRILEGQIDREYKG